MNPDNVNPAEEVFEVNGVSSVFSDKDAYLVWCPYPPCKHRTAATLKRAEAIARKFAEEGNGAPVFIYQKHATAKLVTEVTFETESTLRT